MKGSERDEWTEAERDEIKTIRDMGTYTLTRRLPGTNVISCTWVLKKKCDANNKVVKLNAQLCAQGFSQVLGVDYTKTAAPTACTSSIRYILTLAAKYDWEIHQIDFKNAYLNGQLDEKIYMRQPPSFIELGKEDWVWKLHKALYGLKQAGRQWYKKVCELFSDLGLTRCENDQAVWYTFLPDLAVIVGIHVDDCIIVANSVKVVHSLLDEIASQHEIVRLGPVNWLLGFKVERDRSKGILTISQAAYIDTILSRFGMAEANPVSTPLDPNTTLFAYELTDDIRKEMKSHSYAQIVGSLMYASTGTRPDISYTVSTLARFMADPHPIHFDAAKRVLRYLKGTKDLRLTFGLNDDGLVGYTDADWASQAHRHSISGSVFLVSGGAISWSSRKQPIVALSTTEAEYIAASDACRELLWLRALSSELNVSFDSSTILHCDNQSAIKVAKNGLLHARTKHIDIRYHFIHETLLNGHLDLVYCPTSEMIADVFMKALPRPKLLYFTNLLGLLSA